MSDRSTHTPTTAAVSPDEQHRVEVAGEQAGHTSSESTLVRVLSSPAGRNAGLVIALVILVISEGRVVHEGPASDIDEHRVLDLVMEGSVA